jgi:hypothetical protein
MGKLLFILLFIPLLVSGQVTNLGSDPLLHQLPPSEGGGAAFCVEYQAVYDEMTNKPSASVAANQDTMVRTLVDSGYWARMDLFYVTAQESNAANEADINWIDPSAGTYDLTETGGGALTFTSLEGYTGDGTNYLRPSFNPSTDATQMSKDDATIGAYYRLDINENTYAIGATDGNQLSLAPRWSGTTYTRMNSAASLTAASANSTGMWIATRTASNAVEFFRNGASVNTGAAASVNIPNANLDILARTGGDISNNQISIAFVMDGVVDWEAASITTIIEAYMDSNGKGVIP